MGEMVDRGGKMTDREISRRLYQIAGYRAVRSHPFKPRLWHEKLPNMWLDEWSPLTDWGQLGPLMEARWPTVAHEPGDGGYSVSFNGGSTWRFYEAEDPKRAICLAIIAAHEE